MQPRRHRMRKQQRRASALGWLRTNATVTVKSYAKRYGVDRYTAYEDLTALGVELPDSAQHWAQRPPATPRRKAKDNVDQINDESFTWVDGGLFFVAGYTSGGAPFGIFVDEYLDDETTENEPPDDEEYLDEEMPPFDDDGHRPAEGIIPTP